VSASTRRQYTFRLVSASQTASLNDAGGADQRQQLARRSTSADTSATAEAAYYECTKHNKQLLGII
jgi:hypothetical protein